MLQQLRGRFLGLSFRKKLEVFPWLAAGALALVLIVNMGFGKETERRLKLIDTGHYPSLQASRTQDERMERILRTFQDIIAAHDLDRLADADTLRDAFLATVEDEKRNPTNDPARLAEVDSAFRGYYTAARRY